MIKKFSPPATATILMVLLPLALAGTPHAIAAAPEPDTMNSDNMNFQTAERFARLALDCVELEYPNLIHHVMTGDDDVAPPRELTPAFYGCYDWHSAVHGHWLLARLARHYPESEFGQAAIEALGRNLTRDKLLAEAAYVANPTRTGFERPYGLAWLLQLVAELDEWAELDASDAVPVDQWRDWLRPLESLAVERMSQWIPKLAYPIRIGEHDQTAFAFGLAWDYAEQVGDADFRRLLSGAGQRFYINDRDCPLHYEPSGHDFLSPCLAEADFMRRILPADRFGEWLKEFLPDIGAEGWLPVARVTDRSDGKLAHLDGLNLSRAWMLEGIAAALSGDDSRRKALLNAAEKHAEAGLAGVSDAHYEGGHWLASFAVYLETRRGFSP
ncbi:MAG: DUF2891 domain-containing protein [Wenzhouxiangellaceae bacterium]